MPIGRNAPARHPPNGSWPGVMRADMAAAFFDLETVAALHAALVRGEIPRPTEMRGSGRTREPLWSLDACRTFRRGGTRRPAPDRTTWSQLV